MPIDTSSYYPEVPDPEKRDYTPSLNDRNTGLFGPAVPISNDTSSEYSAKIEKENENKSGIFSNHGNKDNPENDFEKIVSAFSHFLSWVLVPLLMPVYGLIMAFSLSVLDVVSMGLRVGFTFVVAGINFVIPVLLVLLLKYMGIVNDVGLNGRKERLIPYIITALCFGGTAWFMAEKGAPVWLCMFFAGGGLAALINLLINFRWKISAHAAGIAGIVALLIKMDKYTVCEPAIFAWLIITVCMAGLLGSARVWLGRHTPWQVLAGFLVGFCSVFFLMYIR